MTALCRAPLGRRQWEIMPERELWRVTRIWDGGKARSWRVSGLSGNVTPLGVGHKPEGERGDERDRERRQEHLYGA